MYGFVITTAGEAMLARAAAGEALVLDAVMVGRGVVESAAAAKALNTLIDPVAAATSTAPAVSGNQISMTVEYRNDLNGGVEAGFALSEFGISAHVGDDPAALLYYGSLGDAPQPVKPASEGLDVHRFPVAIAVTGEVSVTLGFPTEGFLTEEDLNEHDTSIFSHKDIRKAIQTAQGTADSALEAITYLTNTIEVIPNQAGSLVYNGAAQSPSWNSYDEKSMTIGGTTSATNAGTYQATFTPKEGYHWSDGSTSAKTVSWTIGKATGTLTISKTSIALNTSTPSTTFTIGGNHDGTITVTSNNTGVVSVSRSGDTVTVNNVGQANGSATITVSCTAGTNYTAPGNKTCTVTAEFGPEVSTSPKSGVSYAIGLSGIMNASKVNQIAKAISDNSQITSQTSVIYVDEESSNIHRKISVGDSLILSMPQMPTAMFDIIGFNHDDLYNANAYGSRTATSKAGFTFQLHYLYPISASMDQSLASETSWENCGMRTSQMYDMKNNQLPSEWRSVAKTVKKKYSESPPVSSTKILTANDTCFLLSTVEVFGTAGQSVPGEGTQYAYYKAGNPCYKSQSLDKVAENQWTRSRRSGSATYMGISNYGTSFSQTVDQSFRQAFAFCV